MLGPARRFRTQRALAIVIIEQRTTLTTPRIYRPTQPTQPNQYRHGLGGSGGSGSGSSYPSSRQPPIAMPDNTMMLGPGGGMAGPTLETSERGLTVSSVMKEIAVLKDKFKSDDEDHCTCFLMFGGCWGGWGDWMCVRDGVWMDGYMYESESTGDGEGWC